MATLEETRYIANTVVPDTINTSIGDAGFMMDGVSPLFWLVIIGALIAVVIKLRMQSQTNSKILQKNFEVIEKFARASNGTDIEKVFHDICTTANGEHLAMYTKRDEWYGLAFEVSVNQNKRDAAIPLLINAQEAFGEGEKSGNFFITSFIEKNKSNVIRIFTRDKPISSTTDLYRQTQVLCENGIKLYNLISMEYSSERKARIATITTKLSSSLLSLEYDRERLFFFISHIVMKSVHALEVVIHDEKNNISFNYGEKGSQGISKDFFIHHSSGCHMRIVTAEPLDSVQLNTIGGFIDSSYALFAQEEDKLKHAEEFLSFLIHSNEAMELEFPYFHNHSDLVGIVSNRIATGLHIDNITLKNLEIAAKIHDIGMIADVSFSLGKGDKLSASEMDTIRNHPLYGSIIVEPLNQIYPIGDLIKYHHERYDGQGYPLGLLGDETPLPAQILGFAEHFIGLISDRSYRPGKSFQGARDEMNKMAGHAFNPIVVRAFEQESDRIFNELRIKKPTLK